MKNSVVHLKSNILAPQTFWAGYAIAGLAIVAIAMGPALLGAPAVFCIKS